MVHLNHSASVLNIDNDTIIPGLDSPGPRVINFADILKYNCVPLASTLRIILDVITEAFGTPVEIEFAVDLTKAILQCEKGAPDARSLNHAGEAKLTFQAHQPGQKGGTCSSIYQHPRSLPSVSRSLLP